MAAAVGKLGDAVTSRVPRIAWHPSLVKWQLQLGSSEMLWHPGPKDSMASQPSQMPISERPLEERSGFIEGRDLWTLHHPRVIEDRYVIWEIINICLSILICYICSGFWSSNQSRRMSIAFRGRAWTSSIKVYAENLQTLYVAGVSEWLPVSKFTEGW